MKKFGVIAVLVVLGHITVLAQDRNISVNEVYPPCMFRENGGRFINVKKLVEAGIYSRNAKGDGKTDDSDAIIAAMDWVVSRLKAAGQPCGWHEYWHIYFPDGVYLVSKSLVYSGEPVPDCEKHQIAANREGTAGLKIVGQSRENVVIKLADHLPDFGAGANKPVISFSKFDRGTIFNNAPAGFKFRNITINTGKGNTGAIGLDFYGANTSRLDNVRIVGEGEIGLHVRIGSAHGYYSNLTIDGFKRGLMLEGDTESHPSIEYVSINNSLQEAIRLVGMSVSLRKVCSKGAPVGLALKAKGNRLPHAVILNSQFNARGGSCALLIEEGFLFARDIKMKGFRAGVIKADKHELANGRIHEFVSNAELNAWDPRAKGKPAKSLNLTIEDYPLIQWVPDFRKWASVDDFGATGDGNVDDRLAVQRAFNSGHEVICFPKNSYFLSGTVIIPATVKQIIGGDTRIEGPGVKFEIGERSTDILLIKDTELAAGSIKHSEARDLFLESTSSAANVYQGGLKSVGTKIFANNVHGFARVPGVIENVRAYARFINNEKADHYQINAGQNSTLWVFGFKTEKTFSVFKAEKGAKLEVLGGIMNRFGRDADPDPPGIINDNSSVSIIACTNGPNRTWSPMITDIRGDKTRTIPMTGFPSRGWDGNIVIPLFISTDTR
ncbi:glycosyl hydrolase family 28-related protein [Arcticibacter sp. MXS-1]|uniref:glycosyl hydrolase family 28-related protein n=1 Tax=Arcticibacter sp. MXS-1 TaxID=3341726 RepID=UPI0035A93F96